jgi:hypothetical protein
LSSSFLTRFSSSEAFLSTTSMMAYTEAWRELPRILIPRTSVNKDRSCCPVQPQIPLRVQFIVDSSVVGYDGAVRDEEHSVWQTKPEREQKEETKQSRWGFRGKTVWDFLQLLIVPLMLVAIGLVFSLQQDARQQRIEDQRAEAERELAEQRAQDEALQAYLDQMSQLMLERKLLEAEQGAPVHTLAQARTSTIILRLDAEHNESVIRFLGDSGLAASDEASVSLLREITLSHATLSNAPWAMPT